MKWYACLCILALAAVPMSSSAQEIRTVQIGKIAQVDDRSATTWGMSGMEMLKLAASVGTMTPIMRTLTFDARTVEILSRTQAPPVTGRDVQVTRKNGHDYITVRRYLLMEVMPEDARLEHASTVSLANKWASRIRRVLPQVAPIGNRYGV